MDILPVLCQLLQVYVWRPSVLLNKTSFFHWNFKGKKLITYILFIYSVKMKYKHLIVKWQSTLISPTLPESVRIWIKAAIRIYSTMRLVLRYTAPAGGIWLLPFSLSIQCLLSLEITNPFFFVDKLTLPHSINSPWLFPPSQAPANLLTPHGIPCSAVGLL